MLFVQQSDLNKGISWFHRCHIFIFIFILSSTHKKEKSQVKFVPHNLQLKEKKITTFGDVSCFWNFLSQVIQPLNTV